MSAVCVLTPVVIGSWPVIQPAIAAAMASMGFALTAQTGDPGTRLIRNRVEETVANSEVIEDFMTHGETLTATNGDVQVEFGRDHRGACTICVTGDGYTDNELRDLARQISAKIVQQYTYHKVISELKQRQFSVSSEQLANDGTIKLYVRRGS
jgi:hypothetical protein